MKYVEYFCSAAGTNTDADADKPEAELGTAGKVSVGIFARGKDDGTDGSVGVATEPVEVLVTGTNVLDGRLRRFGRTDEGCCESGSGAWGWTVASGGIDDETGCKVEPNSVVATGE